MSAPVFHVRDPLAPAFWDERFAQRFTPWERGAVPQQLQALLAAWPAGERAPNVLIPGCGSARELVAFSDAHWQATAIDFSPQAVALARDAAGPWRERIVEADFFAWTPAAPLDLIYEQAFLCALPPALRPQVAERWAQLLAPGALLAGYFFFDQGAGAKGPPFGIARAELDALLAPYFLCETDEAVADSIAIFAGKERWLTWRRR